MVALVSQHCWFQNSSAQLRDHGKEIHSSSLRNNYGRYMLQTRVKSWKCTWKVVEVGAREFYFSGDFHVDVGLMCISEKDNEELSKMCGPLCWQGYDKDPGGFKKSCGSE